MNNPSVFHEPKESKLRNDNAEWAALKEVAAIGVRCFSSDVERQLDPQECAKYRRRGEWLLKIVNQIPERPVVEEKTKTLDRVYNVAEKAGVVGDLQRAMEDRMHPKYIGEIGDQTFEGGKKDLSLEEERNLEELRGKVFDLASSAPGELAGQFPSGNFFIMVVRLRGLKRSFRVAD